MPVYNTRATRSSSRLQNSSQATKRVDLAEVLEAYTENRRVRRNTRRTVIKRSESDYLETTNKSENDDGKKSESSDSEGKQSRRQIDAISSCKKKSIRGDTKLGRPNKTSRSESSDSNDKKSRQQNASRPRKTITSESSDSEDKKSGNNGISPHKKKLSDSESTQQNNSICPSDKSRQAISPRKLVSDDFLEEEEKSRRQNNAISPRKKKSLDVENSCVTPPKQRKNEGALFSPSSLLAKLDLNASPTKCLEPKNLFEAPSTSYLSARRALHSTVPVQMPGREKEHEELRRFIKENLDGKTSATLYVSGPPGTGKTASLSTILQQPDILSQFKEVYVNCTAIKSSGAIYARIVKELGLKCPGRTEKDYVAAIEAHLSKNHKMILLVLDEIDQLESKKQSVLYTIFEWPSRKDSKLILIGIANALDLTDRILPRLQARCELKPRLMHFAPYSKQQIVEIFTDRLRQAGVLDLFSPVALQMLAGKVAAISGDVRRALDIGRRVIEIVGSNKTLQPLDTNNGKTCSVDVKHVIGVLNSVYGTSANLDEEEDAFPLQQKIVVCSLLLVLKKAKNKDVNVGKLHEVYRKVCMKRNILAVDQAEFAGLCSLIETKGIIRVSGRKEPRLHKVTLQWDEEEVAATLKDKQLMSVILQDTSVLGKL